MSLTAIILAAGKSTRMKSDLPKPLHEVCGRPMLGYILDAVFAAGAEQALVVVGHGREQVTEAFAGDDRIRFVEQGEQLGTGHAAMVCEPALREIGLEGRDVLIVAGDVPLIRSGRLGELVESHRTEQADASMATVELANPLGYGRVIRDGQGRFVEIVEQADATPEQTAVREVFTSLYCVRAESLVELLGRLDNSNAKGEYYLTDIFGMCRAGGGRVLAKRCVEPQDILAPNTRRELAEADRVMRQRLLEGLMEQGVGVVDPQTTYVEHGVTVGRDTRLYPFTFLGRGATVGSACVIGPFAYVAPAERVADGMTVMNNVRVAPR